jgi:kinesin family protein 20
MDNNINITENIYNIEKEVKCLEDSILKIEENYNVQNIQISNLKEENIILKIKVNNLEIDNIKKDEEIKELKIKVNNLEIDNINLKEENKILKEENKILKIKVNNLEIDNIKKDEEIKELKIKFLINKIYEALTDIINEDKLEEKIVKYNNELIKLKENRNNICHYIKKRDIRDVKNKKIELLLLKLENLEDEIKEIINENIQDVLETEKDIDIIEEITNYYKINKIIINSNNISSKDLKSIENWWKY